MYKWLLSLTVISILLLGCTPDPSKKETNSPKSELEETKNIAPVQIEEETKNTAPVQIEEEPNVVSGPEKLTFADYRPEVGTTKLFYDQGNLIFTEKIIAENEEYVQRVLELGNAVTVQVLKWTVEEITVVYESFEVADPAKNILDTFIPNKKIEPIVSNKSNKEIELIDSDTSIKVPQGDYNHVYIVKKATHEVADGESYLTYYFAPGVGLIKEVYEITGEQGYIAESELQEIK